MIYHKGSYNPNEERICKCCKSLCKWSDIIKGTMKNIEYCEHCKNAEMWDDAEVGDEYEYE